MAWATRHIEMILYVSGIATKCDIWKKAQVTPGMF